MRFTQLRDFLAVVEHHTIRGAARELGIAQPSLTKSIQALEKELGATLFQRMPRSIKLSSAGVAFHTRTQLIMEELRRAKEECQQITHGDAGEVAFAISTAPTFMFLSQILNEFERCFPAVRLRITNGILPITVPQLRAGTLDFAVVPRPDENLGQEFLVETLLHNNRAPICRKSHPLAAAGSLAELTSAQWLVTSMDPDPQAAFDAIFLDHGLTPPTRILYCEMTIALIESLIHRDAICWLPRAWLEAEILKPWLTEIPIKEPPAKGQDICLVQRRNFPLTPAADCLATLIQRQCAYRGGQM
jgi:LysR family transcriptional regulator of abg operon